ncbi:type I-E CRISPR-associated protein Cas6/Cse3/CasE [Anaerococcus sp. mt242]|uniref:type I-E CRISPR-associated protein Cas6/Cse3/CasE n=1 Tax=Anaerococcus sp. mt242 TaxID=2661917 RepID=UPI00193422AE|nr:type I-E CRISPR-associated protein Cas6/Cse3/CasE [Anaerococcus sp. mt242]MBM0046408.1 type I-E CRISPR-associated protein Cas6/Cse3/CasE [Anaerococcus sp. mt242]
MYMSRVEIDFNNRMNLKKLSNLNAYHSWVEESFPDEIKNKTRTRKLWRIDQLKGKNYLLLVSETKPDLDQLEKYGVKGTASTKVYDSFLNKLKNGDIARFKVVLNPTISIKSKVDKSKRGKIVPLKSSEFANYLLDRSLKNGFFLNDDDFLITERKIVPFKHSKNSKKINLDQVTYQGKLKITDKDKMIETLTSGIGKKRAYGFGLMTIILDN